MINKTDKNTNLKDVFVGQIKAVDALSQKIDPDVANRFVEMMLKANRIFITGQGRSGLIAQCLATRLAQMGFLVNVPGQATCQKIDKGDLIIAVSCCGTTATTIQFANVSKDAGAEVAVMTTTKDSKLAKLADQVILFASNDEKVLEHCPYAVGPNNNTLFEQAVLFYMDALIYVLLERKAIPKSIIVEKHTNLE